MPTSLKLFFATHNENKLREIQKMVPSFIQLGGLHDLGLTEEIPETGSTLEENSALKARYVYQKSGVACFADDTGLVVNALAGEPGVYSARYAGEQRDANDNMDLLLRKLAGKDDRSAMFKTVITFIDQAGKPITFTGTVEGTILSEKRGSGGFGYDPIFQPTGYAETFAEMPADEKNRISHRANAFRKLVTFLETLH